MSERTKSAIRNASGRLESGRLEPEGEALRRIHADANAKKASDYWHGFLKGILASGVIEDLEMEAMRAEAEGMAEVVGYQVATAFVRDVDRRVLSGNAVAHRVVSDHLVAAECMEPPKELKRRVNEFYGFCAGIACDGVITTEEALVLVDRIRLDPELSEGDRVQELNAAALSAISAGDVGRADSEKVRDRIACLVGDSFVDTGMATYGSVGSMEGAGRNARHIVFHERTFVITGKLGMGPKKAVGEMIEERGGIYAERLTSETDYLVVASVASRDWTQSSEGRKIQQALEMRRKGAGPEILQEVVLRKAFEFDTLLIGG